ncbi:MAG: hypothetical protein L6408_05315, partial [Nanoarchaeota archaeon]|nr:hypothetical protein [Nanoarchaeota archaeon]
MVNVIKKNVIIGIIILIAISAIVLILFNPYFRGYLESQNELKESNLIQRYEKVTSSLSFNLPDTSDKEKYLNMPNFLTQFGTCYYDAYASIMNYMENISYDKFIWYGRPLMFQYYDSELGVRLGPLRGELGWQAFHNLGYTRYCGNTKGKFAPASTMSYISPDKNYVFFKSSNEALEFIKKLMSAEHPVYIQIKDWAKIPHFQTIFGYNKTHIISPGIAHTPKINWLKKPLPEYYEQPLND